jgi:bifunctional DNase/RNase
MLVQMELVRIIISEINDQQVVFLREVDGERSFPILIGIFEATSIDRRVQGHSPPRPLTHDLLKSTIETLGAEVQDEVGRNAASQREGEKRGQGAEELRR